jgi:hypothetical protein
VRNVQRLSTGQQVGAGAPLTYAGYLGIVLDRHMATGQVPTVRVQVRKRGVMFCGRVLEAAPAREGQDTDWFRVDWQLGQDWFPHANVRQCGLLDGRCLCEGAAEAAGGAPACGVQPAAQAVPLGNTGTTVGAGA